MCSCSPGQGLTSEYVRLAVGLTIMQATVRRPPSQAFWSGKRKCTVMALVAFDLSMRPVHPLATSRVTLAVPG
jgi:hypothetical protein